MFVTAPFVFGWLRSVTRFTFGWFGCPFVAFYTFGCWLVSLLVDVGLQLLRWLVGYGSFTPFAFYAFVTFTSLHFALVDFCVRWFGCYVYVHVTLFTFQVVFDFAVRLVVTLLVGLVTGYVAVRYTHVAFVRLVGCVRLRVTLRLHTLHTHTLQHVHVCGWLRRSRLHTVGFTFVLRLHARCAFVVVYVYVYGCYVVG